MKVVIVGGVAGGASAAARLRRLDEKAEIIMLERSQYVSYANCGLPYYIGGVITDKAALTVQTPESLKERLNLDVRTRHEAVRIDRANKLVEIKDLANDRLYRESYDHLILSPGAEPIRPPFPGADDPRVFTLRTIPDTYEIDAYLANHDPKRALVVGGGFIGLEMAENLHHRGIAVTIAELADHVMMALDADMAELAHYHLEARGVDLRLKNGVQAIYPDGEGLRVELNEGEVHVDMVILSIGVRPESALARDAGLQLSERGAILVDDHLLTSDPAIYAIGDAIAVRSPLTGAEGYVPLAGPANKQGRIVADNIAGIERTYRGTQGTAIVKLFDLVVATTGLSELAATRAGVDYDYVLLQPNSHAGYYPGAVPIFMKVLYEKASGRILGGQFIGTDGVDKRIDVLATAIHANMTADDLTELELAYAPPFSSAKDPVNMAGYIIQNVLEGEMKEFRAQDVQELVDSGAQIVDVRTQEEFVLGHIEGAKLIPLDALRSRLPEIDKSRPVYLYCHSGHRSYLAGRVLAANGFTVSHLGGGFGFYELMMRQRVGRGDLGVRTCIET